MKVFLTISAWLLLVLASPEASAVAHYRAAIGAEVEVLTRRPEIAVIEPLSRTAHESPEAGPGVSFSWESAADTLAIANSGFVRAQVEGTATFLDGSPDPANAGGWAHSSVTLGLVNLSDSALPIDIRVKVPGRYFPELTLNEYLDEGSVDSDPSEVAEVQFGIRLVVDPQVTGLPGDGDTFVLRVHRSTRDSGIGTVFNSFGLPFSRTYTVMVPPSTIVNGSDIEIKIFNLGLWASAEGKALSLFSGSGSAALTAVPEFSVDPTAPLFMPDRIYSPSTVPVNSVSALVILILMVMGAAFFWIEWFPKKKY